MPPPQRKIRLAILETDTPIPFIRDKYGHYTGLFTHLFRQVFASLPPVTVRPASAPPSPPSDSLPPSQPSDGADAESLPPAAYPSHTPSTSQPVAPDPSPAPSSDATDPSTPLRLEDVLTITRHHIVNPPEVGSGCLETSPESMYPRLDKIDAILITGSKHDAFSDELWVIKLVDFVRSVLRQTGIRAIGVCFGHQIIARALGNEVGVGAYGREVAVTGVKLTEEGKLVFGMEKMAIQQMHRDEVKAIPQDATLLAWNEFSATQAFWSPGRYIAVQGHPEYDADIMEALLERRHAMGILSDATFVDGMSRARLPHDGMAIATVFLKFILYRLYAIPGGYGDDEGENEHIETVLVNNQ